jgi:hypothetical protein
VCYVVDEPPLNHHHQGLRTLGVVTKIDLMDKGTDCMDVLLGKGELLCCVACCFFLPPTND